MSQTYFSKLDPKEKESRLMQLGSSRAEVTVWVKGSKNKSNFPILDFVKDRSELVLDTKEQVFPKGTKLLCSFEIRGMHFFSEVLVNVSIVNHFVLEFNSTLFKAEKRSSYRLLTYPIYEVYAEFDLGEAYEGGKVVDMKSRTSQTGLFKSFIQLVEKNDDASQYQKVKHRVQDLSATGMSLHIGELESQYFFKDMIYKDVALKFIDETIVIPEVKVVYVVDYIASDKNLKKFKVGLHFPNMPINIDEKLGKKINKLLREIDFNKDFETFTK